VGKDFQVTDTRGRFESAHYQEVRANCDARSVCKQGERAKEEEEKKKSKGLRTQATIRKAIENHYGSTEETTMQTKEARKTLVVKKIECINIQGNREGAGF